MLVYSKYVPNETWAVWRRDPDPSGSGRDRIWSRSCQDLGSGVGTRRELDETQISWAQGPIPRAETLISLFEQAITGALGSGTTFGPIWDPKRGLIWGPKVVN